MAFKKSISLEFVTGVMLHASHLLKVQSCVSAVDYFFHMFDVCFYITHTENDTERLPGVPVGIRKCSRAHEASARCHRPGGEEADAGNGIRKVSKTVSPHKHTDDYS